jgi:translation initiation factor 1 (eIF-1/SUI1)
MSLQNKTELTIKKEEKSDNDWSETDSDKNSSENDSSDNDSSDDDSNEEPNTAEPNNKLDDPLFDSNIITIFGEQAGRRSNTYVVGLNVDKATREEYLKTLKKGCGGSIKEIDYNEIKQTVIHLQGDQIAKVHAFLKKIPVQQKIIVKPF